MNEIEEILQYLKKENSQNNDAYLTPLEVELLVKYIETQECKYKAVLHDDVIESKKRMELQLEKEEAIKFIKENICGGSISNARKLLNIFKSKGE